MTRDQIDGLYRMGLLTRPGYLHLIQQIKPSDSLSDWLPEYFGQFMQGHKCKEFTGKPTKVLHIKLSP